MASEARSEWWGMEEGHDEHFYAIIGVLAECYKLIIMFIVAKL